MKLLYFGTICNISSYEDLIVKSTKRPTIAPLVFESALLDGFQKNDMDISIYSFPMVPTFPNSPILHFGGQEELLASGYTCRWLKTINLPFFKQWSRQIDARHIIKQWAKENAQEGVILTYSIPPFLVKTVTKLAKKYNVKTAAIVPDLPHNMYINCNEKSLITAVKKLYLNHSLKYCDSYDGYIYLTEAMRDKIAPEKPYIVMEGIFNENEMDLIEVPKKNPRGIMYAGRLHEKYGVIKLIEAFERLNDKDIELWLFGDGTAVNDIVDYSEKDPRIKYFGRVSRDKILQYEKEATLLVNPRSIKEEFTKYSFPSKNIEYMASGTPFLTTRLEGIPKEYLSYVFSVEDNDPELLAQAMETVLSMPIDELRRIGNEAKKFIFEQKNGVVQGKRIKIFLQKILGEES